MMGMVTIILYPNRQFIVSNGNGIGDITAKRQVTTHMTCHELTVHIDFTSLVHCSKL